MGKLHHTRNGQTLCSAHATSGAPAYHHEGCDACAAARAKGIIRPNIETVPKKKRGSRRHLEPRIDWEKIPQANRAGMAAAMTEFRKHMG
jgi:hypothetical protein